MLQLKPAHPGHPDVENRAARGGRGVVCQKRAAVFVGLHMPPFRGQHEFQRFPHRGVIVHGPDETLRLDVIRDFRDLRIRHFFSLLI